jgi:hypothetical protein
MSGGGADDLVEVRILGLPLALANEAQEHFDELSREFLHLANADDAVRHDVPGRLLALSDDLRSRFSAFTTAQEGLLDEAIERGDDLLDLTYHVPAAAGPAAAELADLLDEADRYCAAGTYLLTLTTPPGALAYRRWYIGQFVDQIAGRPPVSFAAWSAAGSATTAPD